MNICILNIRTVKRLILLILAMPYIISVNAQSLKSGYISWPDSKNLASYVRAWTLKVPALSPTGIWEDEEFFISRQKPHYTFINRQTQVDTTITPDTDKRLIWWVPIGDSDRNGVHTDALPNGIYDSETFSMWSYITHFGDWTSPHGWVPGSLADAAHKNGVAVTGLANIPYGPITDAWGKALDAQTTLLTTELGNFLHYHGVDGLAYNSEFSGYNPSALISQHQALSEYLEQLDPLHENVWYAGTVDRGSIHFDIGLSEVNTELFNGASLFLNYNWNRPDVIESSIRYAESTGRSPLSLYAGFNMQGGEPLYGDTWDMLAKYRYSIGLWGAHNCNMLWQDRGIHGSSDAQKQKTYLHMSEQWFGNGRRNPAIRMPITTQRRHRPNDGFCGMSSMMTARSALGWDLSAEPFISCFNIGNGTFFNIDGQRVCDRQWYNIGVQDYLPTWRYWFAPTLLEGDVNADDVHLNADITWDDAWFGGSCLEITGTAYSEYLHLFKTAFRLCPGDLISITYKLCDGSAKASLTLSEINDRRNPGDAIMLPLADDDTLPGEWTTRAYELNAPIDTLDLIAIHITDAEDMRLLIGRIAITRGTYPTPDAPIIKGQKVLANNRHGIDGKLRWTMPDANQLPQPTYNQDLGVSMFKVYAQEDGGSQQMMDVTTSWAALIYAAPNTMPGAKIRFGVSAMSLDMHTESSISWSKWVDKGQYALSDDILLDKEYIQCREPFTISFADPMHPAARFDVMSSDSTIIYSGDGTAVRVPGINTPGIYDLHITDGDGLIYMPGLLNIYDSSKGMSPEIIDLSVDGCTVSGIDSLICVTTDDTVTLSYTGRKADGRVSRGLNMDDKWIGVNMGELGLTGGKSFTVAAWVRYDRLSEGLNNFITIEDRTNGGWPYNNWGLLWSRLTGDGRLTDDGLDNTWCVRTRQDKADGQRLIYAYDKTRIPTKAWVHVALTFEYQITDDSTRLRQSLYVNGIRQHLGAWLDIDKSAANDLTADYGKDDWLSKFMALHDSAQSFGYDTYTPDYVTVRRYVSDADWLAFGGWAQGVSSVEGCIDDLQIWDKALDDNGVQTAMHGIAADDMPPHLLAWWDFETDPDDGMAFKSLTGRTDARLHVWSLSYGDTEDEGAGIKVFEKPQYRAGSPFIDGHHDILTEARWTLDGNVVRGTGDDAAGSLTIAGSARGTHHATVTLANLYGADTAQYPIIKVTDKTGIAQPHINDVIYMADGHIYISVESQGCYSIKIYDAGGRLMKSEEYVLPADGLAAISIPYDGISIITIIKDGIPVKNLKISN